MSDEYKDWKRGKQKNCGSASASRNKERLE